MVEIDGNSYTCSQLPVTFKWSSTSTHSYSFQSLVGTQYPSVRFNFSSASGCGTYSQSGSITPTYNCTVTGYYQTQYLLSMASTPNGAGTLSPGTEWLNSGTSVTISETPKSGYSFNFWTGRGSGSYSGNAPSTTIILNSPITETANYTAT